MRAGLPLVALLAGLLIPAGALADDVRTRARVLFDEGNRLRASRDHVAALAKFREAYRLAPSYKIDLNMGLTLLDLGRRAEAAVVLERFLHRGAHRSPSYIVTVAHRRLARLKKRLASVRIQCPVSGAIVMINGQDRGRTPLHEAVYFEVAGVPITFDITVGRRGYYPLTLKRVLRPGRHVDLEVVLRPRPKVPGARVQMDLGSRLGKGPAVPDASEQMELDDSLGPWPTRADVEAGDPILVQQRQRKTLWGYALLGTGLACVVTAGVLYGVGVSSGDEAHDQYQASTASTDQSTIDVHREDVEAARAKVAAGNVLLGVAAVAAGISIYLLVTRPSTNHDPVASRPPGVGVMPVRGGAAFSFGGQF